MKFVAFIRNINVGQKKFPNRLQLEQAFLASGAHSAVSFQSNGTVVVDLDSNTNLASFTQSVKAYLLSVANFSEAIFLRDLETIRLAVAQDPFAVIDFTGYDGKCVAYYDYAEPVDGIFPLESVKQDCLVFAGTRFEAYSITRRIKGVSGYPTPLLEKRLQTPVTTRSWTTILRLTSRF